MPTGVALACQLARDPRYVQQMLRPSRDGNPHHVDVRFYSPAMDVDPHIVTLDDWLPLPGDAPAPAAVGVPLILKGLATFLDEHLTSPATPAGAGYVGLATLDSEGALAAIVGQSDTFYPPGLPAEVALGWLRGNLSAGHLVALTTLPSNLPGPTMDALPGLLERRSYAVLDAAADAAGPYRLQLSGPWAASDPGGGAGTRRWVPWDALRGLVASVTWAPPGLVA